MKWTYEETSSLLKLHGQGLSPRAIAAHFGKTRNAVLGKLFRLKKACPAALSRPRLKKGRSAPVRIVFEKDRKTGVTLAEIKNNQCRYPYESLWCGRVISEGSFCKKHAEICYTRNNGPLVPPIESDQRPDWIFNS